MSIHNRLRKLTNKPQTHLRTRCRTRRLAMEALEHKRLLATLTVTSLSDDTLANLAGDGQLSLREAVVAANLDTSVDGSLAGSGADTIEFAPGLAGGTISLSGTELKLTDNLTINGLGADDLTVSGNNASRIFSIESGVTVNIAGLMIADGDAYEGGAIYNNGKLSVQDSELSGNTSFNDGGGVWNSGTLEITGSKFSSNRTTGESGPGVWGGVSGGAIWNGGLLEIAQSEFSNNSAVRQGGGIHSVGGTVVIADSTFTGNSATSSGSTGVPSPALFISTAQTARLKSREARSLRIQPAVEAPSGAICLRLSQTARSLQTRHAAREGPFPSVSRR